MKKCLNFLLLTYLVCWGLLYSARIVLALPSILIRSLLVKIVSDPGETVDKFTRSSNRAQDRSSPVAEDSSAARSSLITILLLQPEERHSERWETAGSGGYGGSRGPQHNQTTPVISKRVREWDVTREVLRPRSGAHTTQLMMIENSDQWLQDWGPAQELTQPCKLLSSAARSSLITILLLQPVFFLRSASRPGPNVWGESTGARPATQEKILWQWW